jgi:hypothetical protein
LSVSGRAEDLGIIIGQTDKTDEKEPFDRFLDAKEIQTFLRDTCFAAFNRRVLFIYSFAQSVE